MGKKKAAETVHNDIDEIPAEETAEEFDDESPSDVLGIDIGKPGGEAKADTPEEPDERPGEDVLAAVAEEAAQEDDETATEEEEEGDDTAEGISVDADEPGADEDGEPEMRTVKFERDGELMELTVPVKEADALEGYFQAANTTRGQYAHLQDKYLEVVQARPAQPAETPGKPTPDQATTRLNQMMGNIPQVVEAYTPVVEHVRDSLPEEHQLREFIEDNPVVATILAAMWDGQEATQAQARVTQAERYENQFKGHVDGLLSNIIQSDEANAILADADVRDQFDNYLVSLGPLGADGNPDPAPIRQVIAQDDGRWLGARWDDFRMRAALSGAKPAGGDTPPKTGSKADQDRRRAIDPGSARSGGRPKGQKAVFAKEVSDVLNSG